MYSGFCISFNEQIAQELGIHAAIIFNIIKCTPCNQISKGYITAIVGSFMNEDEIKHGLNKLKNSNFIKGDFRFSISDGEE